MGGGSLPGRRARQAGRRGAVNAQHTKCPRASAATYNVFLKRKSDNKSVSVRLAEFVFL